MGRPQLRYTMGSGVAYPQPAGSGTITHGSQVTLANTGYGAYYDSGLGRFVLLSDLTVTAGTVSASDFTTAGGTISKRRFTGDLIFDINDVTARACLFDNPTTSYSAGTHRTGTLLDYCTVSPATAGDECMHYESWSANRWYFRGCDHGVVHPGDDGVGGRP